LEEYKDDQEREREEKKHHLYQLEQYLQELPVVGFNTGKYDVNALKVDFFYSIGGQSQDQVYRETEHQFHVYQDREAEVSRHRELFGGWF